MNTERDDLAGASPKAGETRVLRHDVDDPQRADRSRPPTP